MNLGRNLIFLPGTLVNPLWFVLVLLVLLGPLCLLSGYAFALLVKAGEEGKFRFPSFMPWKLPEASWAALPSPSC